MYSLLVGSDRIRIQVEGKAQPTSQGPVCVLPPWLAEVNIKRIHNKHSVFSHMVGLEMSPFMREKDSTACEISLCSINIYA